MGNQLVWNNDQDAGNFIPFLSESDLGDAKRITYYGGEMLATNEKFVIIKSEQIIVRSKYQNIGNLIEKKYVTDNEFYNYEYIENDYIFLNAELVYESNENEKSKIAEINKKIIVLFIIGLSLLIIIFIIKFNNFF